MFQAIAIHHARPEHVDDFIAFMRRVREAVGDPPGLIQFDGYRDAHGGSTLAGISVWESEEAFRAALPLITSLGPERSPEWSERPDDVLTMTRF